MNWDLCYSFICILKKKNENRIILQEEKKKMYTVFYDFLLIN